MKQIKIIKPTIQDLETVVKVEQSAWPDIGEGMVAEYDKFKTRIELGLMNLLYLNEEPGGIISFQKPSFTKASDIKILLQEASVNGLLDWNYIQQKFNLPKDWYEATYNGNIKNETYTTHNPKSDCAFLIGIGVDNKLKGNGLVNHLISHTIAELKHEGIKFVLGYGRLPQLHEEFEKATIKEAEDHLQKLKPGTILPADYGARFHIFNGAKAISVIPNAMDDSESLNYGFLAVYDLTK